MVPSRRYCSLVSYDTVYNLRSYLRYFGVPAQQRDITSLFAFSAFLQVCILPLRRFVTS